MPVVGRVRCPECKADIGYHRDDTDKPIVVEASRALALEAHDAEHHWPTVIAAGPHNVALRCHVCHGTVNRLSSKTGSPWVIVSPCGHREGADQAVTCRQAHGYLSLVNSATYSVWIFQPSEV